MRSILFVLASCLTLVACNTVQSVRDAMRDKNPYEKYIRALESSHLDKTLMAQLWVRAGERALKDSIVVPLPYSESGYFRAAEPDARSYTFVAREGQVLTINGAIQSRDQSKIFLELFSRRNGRWVAVSHADSSLTMSYEFAKNDTCRLRIQPELLANVFYTLNVSVTPVLINPVAGAGNRSIGSFYGADRDGGKRKHEGVDIFAKKGTPVIAPTDGYISKVGTSKLGGKVVWLQDRKRNHSYYFAHLDQQLVKAGARVSRGDTLGTVGNTGNARNTPSHLHFGIYQSRSKDPIDYIQTLEDMAEALPWDTTLTRPDFRVMTKQAKFRSGPNEKSVVTAQLPRGTYVRVLAQGNNWFRVKLPNEQQGFISRQVVEPLSEGKKMKLKSPAVMYADIRPGASPVAHLPKHSFVHVLASFDTHRYVLTKDGIVGWMML